MEWSQQPLFRSQTLSRTPQPPKLDHRTINIPFLQHVMVKVRLHNRVFRTVRPRSRIRYVYGAARMSHSGRSERSETGMLDASSEQASP